MAVSTRTKQLLAFRSGNVCALPDCQKTLAAETEVSQDPYVAGEAAHIAGDKSGKGKQPSARFDPNMTDEARNHYRNLIYLCRSCHRKIDVIPQGERDYPIERLQKIKLDHETKVYELMIDGFAEVGFPELSLATEWIQQITTQPSENSFTLLNLADKLKKNQLNTGSQGIIKMGLAVAPEVTSFIENTTQIDDQFPERLKLGFLKEYTHLRFEGHRSDDLFDLMCNFAKRGFPNIRTQMAGIAVLIYLFENCEVFEK